jgi:hypothetical protein
MLIFRKFIERQEAINCKEILGENNIEAQLEYSEDQLEGMYAGDKLNPKFILYLNATDFEKADLILNIEAERSIRESELDNSYYLHQFSSDELLEILCTAHEWSEYDRVLAKKILLDRNVTVDYDYIKNRNIDKVSKLAQAEKIGNAWLITGYFFSVIGGFLGLLIGYFYWKSRKTLPNGTSVFSYDENSRAHAKSIFLISLVSFPLWIILKVWKEILLYA